MRILVVEDSEKMSRFIKQGLNEIGYAVDVTHSGVSAEVLVSENDYDLVLLDIMLPDQSGIVTAQNIRKDGYAGSILMLTALATTKDKVAGLDAGADDYLTKPYSFEELQARIRALLRRNSHAQQFNNALKYSDLEIDLQGRTVKRGGQLINLTSKEFALLEYLMRNAERPVGRVSIAEHVWDLQFDSDSNVIDVYINMLRKKIDSPFNKKLIQTVVGTGYALKELN